MYHRPPPGSRRSLVLSFTKLGICGVARDGKRRLELQLRVTGCPSDYVRSVSGVPEIALPPTASAYSAALGQYATSSPSNQ